MDQRPKAKTKTLFGENKKVTTHDFGFGSVFLDMTPKAQATN